jgi:hypothetical protein
MLPGSFEALPTAKCLRTPPDKRNFPPDPPGPPGGRECTSVSFQGQIRGVLNPSASRATRLREASAGPP